MLERVTGHAGSVMYRSPSLRRLGVPHVFTTRHVAGELVADPALLSRACGASLPRGVVRMHQVHGGAVHVDDGSLPPVQPRVDALVTDRGDRLVVVHAADCVPVLVAEADGGRVAAIHAGWRGLLEGVIARALASLDAAGAVAAIGPCLSLEHFEVGADVAARFEAAGLAEHVVHGRWPRPHVDLRAVARQQLARAGVAEIDVSDRCTWEHAADFCSHRRDVTHGGAASTGRLAGVIGPRLGALRPGAAAPGV